MKEFIDDSVFRGRVTFQILPVELVSIIKITTPRISGVRTFICNNTAPITMINFLGGADNQRIHLLGDSFTTIANNSNIKTNTGADKLLGINKVYNFTLINNIWYEDA